MTLPIPHLAWPPRLVTLADGRVTFGANEQGSDAEIEEGLRMVCELRADQLPWDPDLGIPDPLGAEDPDGIALEIQAALTEIEQRVPIVVSVIDGPEGRRLVLRIDEAPEGGES